jgi:hypothetical protein
MTDQKTTRVLGASLLSGKLCPVCNGNDGDVPCAYPSEGKQGCLMEARRAISERNRHAEYLRSCIVFATQYKGA